MAAVEAAYAAYSEGVTGVVDQQDSEARMLASKWTPFGVSLHKLLSTTAGPRRACPAWVESACEFVANKGKGGYVF